MIGDPLMPLRSLHGRIYEAQKIRTEVKLLCRQLKEADVSTVLFVLSPSHGNLGDHAIALSATEMLTEMGINYIEITTVQLNQLKRFRKLGVMNGRKIVVNGGGNLGTLWFHVEELFRSIIRSNPNSTIVCLPNTIFYEKSRWGDHELEQSKKIYNRHPSLLLYAREQSSFSLMRGLYTNVKLIPDMVLFMNKSGAETDRKGCLLCLRNDLEKTRTEELEGRVLLSARCLFHEQVTYSDMCLDHRVLPSDRVQALEEKFNEFRSTQLVITDRLHGMLFAAITGTPCIVIDSKSPKLRSCYEWIRHLEYIRFADDAGQIEALYMKMPKSGNQYDSGFLKLYREELRRDMLKLKE